MSRLRFSLITFLFSWSLVAVSQSQDYVVENFHENTTDLSAVSSNIRDLNGTPAALIRFAVRDTLFEFVANIGILKMEKKTGEVWLYVPQGTKRLTFRHPRLGVLRDYVIPVPIVSKTTYDADIRITNQLYLQSLLVPTSVDNQNNQVETDVTPPIIEDSYTDVKIDEVENPVVTPQETTVTTPERRTPLHTHVFIGGGYNAVGMMGPSASFAVEIGKFFVGLDYILSLDKVENVSILYKYSGMTEMGEAYDYSASRLSVRIGINPSPDATFQVLPQAGVSFNMIKGSEIVNKVGGDAQFAESYPISAFGALRFQLKLGENFCLHVTPQYDFAAFPDDVYGVLKGADDKIKLWGEGFGLNAGILLRF